ncbi:hypothetical protein JCM5353_007777, partial [Sporobolomyces roseus]
MSLTAQSTKLPRLLSLLPQDGVGSLIYPSRWKGKGLPTPSSSTTTQSPRDACFYDIKKVSLTTTEAGKLKGEAFGVLYWKGKRVTPIEQEFERVKGGDLWQSSQPPIMLQQLKREEQARKLSHAATVE